MDSSHIQLIDINMKRLLEEKFRLVYSERVGTEVYVLIDWLEKSIFKKYKNLYRYTDIGWIVRHPKQLIRSLIRDGIITLPS